MGGSSVLGAQSGALIRFAGTLMGIVVIFLVAKYLGRSVISKLVDEKKLEKFNEFIKKNETLVILMLFILPILPDEVICVGAGLAGIDAYKFIGIAALSKLVTSFSLSYSLKLITFDIKTVMVGTVLIMIAVLVNKLSKR